MARIKAIIFDLDDTLYDCSGSLVEAARRRAAKAMVAAGLPCSEDEAYRLQVELTARHGPSYRVFDNIAERYGKGRDLVEAALSRVQPRRGGGHHALPRCHPHSAQPARAGLQLFLVTSGVHRRQEQKIDLLGMRQFFDEICINDSEIGSELEECYHRTSYPPRPDAAGMHGRGRPHRLGDPRRQLPAHDHRADAARAIQVAPAEERVRGAGLPHHARSANCTTSSSQPTAGAASRRASSPSAAAPACRWSCRG